MTQAIVCLSITFLTPDISFGALGDTRIKEEGVKVQMNLGSGVVEHGDELRLSTGAALLNGWRQEVAGNTQRYLQDLHIAVSQPHHGNAHNLQEERSGISTSSSSGNCDSHEMHAPLSTAPQSIEKMVGNTLLLR